MGLIQIITRDLDSFHPLYLFAEINANTIINYELKIYLGC